MILGESQQFASPEEALAHFGVKGMKWGVRKEEDTGGQGGSQASAPALSAKKQQKVDKFLQRADVMQTRISEIKVSNEALKGTRNPAKLYARANNKQIIKQLEGQQKRAVKDAEAVQKGKLTSKQKQVVAGAVVVSAIVGAGLLINARQSGALNSWRLMGQARLRGQKVPFPVDKSLSRKMSAKALLEKVGKPVNPGYSTPGGKMNCRRCTYAYELRRRGFDVHATTSAAGYGQSESGVINALTTKGKDYFKATSMSTTVVNTGKSSVAPGDRRKLIGGRKFLDGLLLTEEQSKANVLQRIREGGSMFDSNLAISSSDKVLKELGGHPEGARGEVLFKFGTFGHSMAWEIVNGVPKIFDTQKGTLYDAAHRVESKWDGFTAAEIRRLDNLDLDINFLTRWATKR